MIVLDVMQELESRLRSIPKMNTYDHVPDAPAVPCGLVALPDRIMFDKTYGRGSDAMDLEVTVLIGRTPINAASRNITRYADPTGEHSVKWALEKDMDGYQSCDDVQVVTAAFDIVRHGQVDYLACIFSVHIEGSGV